MVVKARSGAHDFNGVQVKCTWQMRWVGGIFSNQTFAIDMNSDSELHQKVKIMTIV